ncbi:MAG: hypothetical protein R2752_10720 [Vicinamibacterales bacterium]
MRPADLAPTACVVIAAVLIAAWLPLPGALPVVAALLIPVWGLEPHLVVVWVRRDRPLGRVQPIACAAPAVTRGPPDTTSR